MDKSIVNTKNGCLTIDIINADEYTLRSKRDDGVSVELDMGYDEVAELRAMLWDAMRRQGRGFEISIDDVLKIEEVRHKGRYSVEGYKEEINWTIDLLQRHLTRIESWQDSLNLTPAEDRGVYGKLDEFLSQLEEQPRIQEKIHSKDALNKAYQDGWEQGAADATDHRDYDLSLSESMHDEWDKRYATGYDAGFEKVATSDEPPETPSRPEYIRESRFA